MTPSSESGLKPCPFCGENLNLSDVFDDEVWCETTNCIFRLKTALNQNAYCWKREAELMEELEEQARLLGMSGSREAKLLADLGEAVKALKTIERDCDCDGEICGCSAARKEYARVALAILKQVKR